MRPEVQTFVADGPLPDRDAHESEIERRERQLLAITGPVNREEARALAECFGPDDCYGLAWTLLHLIETGPGPLPVSAVRPTADPEHWDYGLRQRWGLDQPSGDAEPLPRGDADAAGPVGAAHRLLALGLDPQEFDGV